MAELSRAGLLELLGEVVSEIVFTTGMTGYMGDPDGQKLFWTNGNTDFPADRKLWRHRVRL